MKPTNQPDPTRVDPLSLAADLMSLVGRLVRLAEPAERGSIVELADLYAELRARSPYRPIADLDRAVGREPAIQRDPAGGIVEPAAVEPELNGSADPIPPAVEPVAAVLPTAARTGEKTRRKRKEKPRSADPPLPAEPARKIGPFSRDGLELDPEDPDGPDDDEPTGDLDVHAELNGTLAAHDQAVVDEAAAKKARKRESDRRYAEKKRAARQLARAIGNPVESAGSPPPVSAGREPVIAGPTAPVERLAEPAADEIDTLDLAFTTCADLRAKGLTTVDQVAAALNEEFALMGLTEAQIIAIEKAIAKARPKPRKPKPAPDPDPLDGLFVVWRGKMAVYGIKAPSLVVAKDYMTRCRPENLQGDLRPDMDGTIKRLGLTVVIDLTKSSAKPEPSATPERRWEVFDLRQNPPSLLGEVAGANYIRALIAAEKEWPDLPDQMTKIVEIVVRPNRPASRPQPDPDRDLAEFRREFDAAGEAAAARLERTEPDREPANGRRKAVVS
jgi:hypothetical protein